MTIDKHDAARKIQRFWFNKKGLYAFLGDKNHDYYVNSLHFSDKDHSTRLAAMMYGRVITTPMSPFPFLKQSNPYVDENSKYHRLDYQNSRLETIILEQWGYSVTPDCFYIPLVNSHLGAIQEELKILLGSSLYSLISAPDESGPQQLLLFMEVRLPASKQAVWFRLSSLGLIASPWLLSSVAAQGGHQPECAQNTQESFSYLESALQRQPDTIDALKQSDVMKKLQRLEQRTSSLFTKTINSIINNLPNIEAEDIIRRIAWFLEMALMKGHQDHAYFAQFIYAIIHEASLMLLRFESVKKTPYISFDEFKRNTFQDISSFVNLPGADYQFMAHPAYSGLHANCIASTWARDVSQKKHKKTPTVRREGGEYWEVSGRSQSHTLFADWTDDVTADIVRISAGPIGDYEKGTYPAIDINKLIRAEVIKNSALQVIIVDVTSASYHHITLADDVVQLIQKHNLSVFFWESCQKFGLLHTDQAQYGRVFAFCNKTNVDQSFFDGIDSNASHIMSIPDIQIGAFIHQNCNDVLRQIRERHFDNGAIFREILLGQHDAGVNKSCAYELRVDQQRDPFVYLKGSYSDEMLDKIDLFFKIMQRERSSFGHSYTTKEGMSRIAVGAEDVVDVVIFTTSLKYYIDLSHSEIRQKLLDIGKEVGPENLVDYVSMLTAWDVAVDEGESLTWDMAWVLRYVIQNSRVLRTTVFDGSSQCIRDMYRILAKRSPFRAMYVEACSLKNAITRVVHSELITSEIIMEHTQKLHSGDYSSTAAQFFGTQTEVSQVPPVDERAGCFAFIYEFMVWLSKVLIQFYQGLKTCYTVPRDYFFSAGSSSVPAIPANNFFPPVSFAR